ncbi:MAG: MFS transporter [Opitutus sp.]|nr:MFS transporter [Opitutus sp.]
MPPTPAAADLRVLFISRIVRMFAYGMLGVVLVLFLVRLGFDGGKIGLLLSLTLLGDVAISLWLTAHADGWGRRKTLVVGAVLMALGGAGLAASESFLVLIIAGTIGVISPTGGEVGPFQAVEQACLAQEVADRSRTRLFAWYNLAGYLASALGALAVGWLLGASPFAGIAAYRIVFWIYAACGVVLGGLALCLSPAVEAPVTGGAMAAGPTLLGLRESRGLVVRLSALFALDSFGGGFVLQSFLAWWLQQKFAADAAVLGAVFFGTNLLSGLSGLAAVPLAKKIGLINTMVWTHLPSNVLLMLVPLMPTLPLAIACLLARHLLSQMDVPTRASYLSAIVPAAERAAANGATSTAKQLGTALGPLIAGKIFGAAAGTGLPFFVCGGLKCSYDLMLWRAFRKIKPPEER